jgi:N-methylhydantoinase B
VSSAAPAPRPAAVDPVELALFAAQLAATCDEMGATLRHSAFSPNIRDRLDYSCAVFDAAGELAAQAAHIPVHLGSMAYAMKGVVARIDWRPGDVYVFNDPYLGGTHLPDVTAVAPVFLGEGAKPIAFVADRAHHADIGADTPGSMPIATVLDDEGEVIPPTRLVVAGAIDGARMARFAAATRNPRQVEGDFTAQLSACAVGVRRVAGLAARLAAPGDAAADRFATLLAALNDHAERLAHGSLAAIPDGEYRYADRLDDDGLGHADLAIAVTLRVSGGRVEVDFEGTAAAVAGNVNCPLPVAAAGALYCFRCLMPDEVPMCAGSFRAISLRAPPGCLVNARSPSAVAAGNVETSQRIVDAVFGALAQALPDRIPAASQGTMNNLAMGSAEPGHSWDYYETIGGGMGASPRGGGTSCVQVHMTNTLNTPIEVLELAYPVRVRRYARRHGSGGAGRHLGGDGIVREYEFLRAATVTVLSERRTHAPWGLAGGAAGAAGVNRLNGEVQPGKFCWKVAPGDVLRIETPGGGGWGAPAVAPAPTR